MEAKHKPCIKCGIDKLLEEFHRDRNRKDGRRLICKVCAAEYQKDYQSRTKDKRRKYDRAYRINNRDKLRAAYRKNDLKKNFDISIDEYEIMEKKQNGLCAICGLPETAKRKGVTRNLCVDHNHNTGKIRGLLCRNCNTAIGMLEVDNFGIMNLQTAIKYLQKVA